MKNKAQNVGTEGLEYYPLAGGTYAVGAGSAVYLSEIVIPSSYNGAAVTEIISEGFVGCDKLEKITLPDTLVTVGSDAFKNCETISEVHISDLEAWCRLDFQVSIAAPLSYDYKLYLNDELVTDLVIPDGITRINNGAFCGCSSLTSVTIHDGVTDIGNSAFSNCPLLERAELPEGLDRLNMYVFSNAESLESIQLPESLTVIDVGAFSGCINLDNLHIPDRVTEIGNSAFSGCSSLSEIILPAGVGVIGDRIFNGCYSLERAELPDGITRIGEYAFAYCSLITDIRIPDGVEEVGKYAFYDCSSLKTVIIPASLTDVGEYAFDGCELVRAVYYGGTEDDWRINFLWNNIPVQTAPRYYYSQNPPAEAGNFWHYAEDGKTPVKW